MKSRILCLMLIMPLLLLGLSACGSDSKPAAKAPSVPDPEGGAKPKLAGKAG
jgi:hypothetical protein